MSAMLVEYMTPRFSLSNISNECFGYAEFSRCFMNAQGRTTNLANQVFGQLRMRMVRAYAPCTSAFSDTIRYIDRIIALEKMRGLDATASVATMQNLHVVGYLASIYAIAETMSQIAFLTYPKTAITAFISRADEIQTAVWARLAAYFEALFHRRAARCIELCSHDECPQHRCRSGCGKRLQALPHPNTTIAEG